MTRRPETLTIGGITLAKLSAGTFVRGLTEPGKAALEKAGRWQRLFADEMPAREIRLSRPFWIAVTEITQAQWKAFQPSPAAFPGDNLPVERVSWHDARAFCDWLSKKHGGRFRLPTEAEWEYAAGPASDDPLDEIAWHFGNAGSRTHPVGTKRPNARGLFDVLGNVWEWCEDAYSPGYYARSPAVDPLCQTRDATERVFRGGAWAIDPARLRVTLRGGQLPTFKSPYVGFRIVREA